MKKRTYFYYGVVFYACIYSIVQDFMGKEKYLAYIDHSWVEPYISLPIAITLAIAILAVIVYYAIKKAIKKRK